jgi:hypothetical protein
MADGAVWKEKAAKVRRLALGLSDQRTINALLELAEEYEAKASTLETQPTPIDTSPSADLGAAPRTS